MALRWRKNPRETGLRAVGAGPRGSCLFLDGETEYLASVNPFGGNWRGPLEGWYWVVPKDESKNLEYMNTCYDLCETEKQAKDEAKAYVQEALRKLKQE